MRLREALTQFFRKISKLFFWIIRFFFCSHQNSQSGTANSASVSLVSRGPTTTAAVTTTLGAPEESKIPPKLRWEKAITKIQEQRNFPPRLTIEAANFMFDNGLTMRNSYTTQVMSLHYKIRHFPETHSAGRGQYGVPLWTVKLKELPKPGQDPYDRCHSDNFAFTGVSEEAKQYHLDNFLDKIKSFLENNVPFGTLFSGEYFNYELLIAKPRFPSRSLSDIGTYSTGGRTYEGVYDAQTIIYRATLNAYEIRFIKDILERKHDDRIPGIHEKKSILDAAAHNKEKINGLRMLISDPESPAILDLVTNTARYAVCHRLCIEIIAAKLVLFLNTTGQSKYNVIALSAKQLNALLTRVIEAGALHIQGIFHYTHIHRLLLAGCSPKKYLESEKYPWAFIEQHQPAYRRQEVGQGDRSFSRP